MNKKGKRPGRPPKNPIPNIETKIEKVENARFQYDYNNPGIFKQIISIISSSGSPSVLVNCGEDHITFYSRGCESSVKVFIPIYGKELDHCYSDSDRWLNIPIASTRIKTIMEKGGKTNLFKKITIYQTSEDCIDGKMNIAFFDPTTNANRIHSITCTEMQPLQTQREMSIPHEEDFDFNFQLPLSNIQSYAKDNNNFSRGVSNIWQLRGNSSFCWKNFINDSHSTKILFNDLKNIKLVSSLEKDEVCEIQFPNQIFTAIISKLCGTNVKFLCKNDEPIVIDSIISEGFRESIHVYAFISQI